MKVLAAGTFGPRVSGFVDRRTEPKIVLFSDDDVSATVEAMYSYTKSVGVHPAHLVDLLPFLGPGHWRAYAEMAGVMERIPKGVVSGSLVESPSPQFMAEVSMAYVARVGRSLEPSR